MKSLYIVANWKANKTEKDGAAWLAELAENLDFDDLSQGKEIIICPPFTLLSQIKKYIDANNLPFTLGSQDVSAFDKGAYTGEIPAVLVKEFVSYSIIGHSERRQELNEDDELLKKKVSNAKASDIIPIFCVQNETAFIPEGVQVAAYEPIGAIGTGNPDTPENADKTASEIKSKNKEVTHVLYGGSVTPENIEAFTNKENIDGVLVGGASLEAPSFVSLIKKC